MQRLRNISFTIILRYEKFTKPMLLTLFTKLAPLCGTANAEAAGSAAASTLLFRRICLRTSLELGVEYRVVLLNLKRADVRGTIGLPHKRSATLIVTLHAVTVIDGWAATHQRVCPGRAAVIFQIPKQGTSVDRAGRYGSDRAVDQIARTADIDSLGGSIAINRAEIRRRDV